MGYDCTFHVIDEQAIRDSFVSKLLQRTDEETELDRVMDDAESLWVNVQGALNGKDPENPKVEASPELAASLVSQLAVMFSACSLPHHYERGLAFSLWDRLDIAGAGEFPESFAFDPEPLFHDVVEEFPALRGNFNRWFTSNYSTGVFIPAEHVPEVLAWLENLVQTFPKSDRRIFKGLLAILRLAATRKLGFWEATDLAVPIAGTVPGDPLLMTADYLHNLQGEPRPYVERAPVEGILDPYNWSIVADSLITADQERWRTSCWDLSTWPPRQLHVVEEFASYRARLSDGRWLLFSSDNAEEKPRIFRPRLLGADSSWQRLPSIVIDGAEQSVSIGGCVGDMLIVFQPVDGQSPMSKSKVLAPPIMLNHGKWVRCPGLRPVEGRPSAVAGWIENPVRAIVTLADGTDLLLWDGDGYEWRSAEQESTGPSAIQRLFRSWQKGKFELTFPISARKPERTWTAVTSGDDGLFYLSNRHMFEAHRGRPPIAHVHSWANIMYLFRGPEGSLIVREGDNKDGDAAKLYFPHDGTFIHIGPELFDDNEYSFVYWSEASDRFLVHYNKEWLSIPTTIILNQSRYRADTGAAIKGPR